MSRSNRKTPISSYASTNAQKRFKQAEHRRERRTIKQQLEVGKEDYELNHSKQYGNEWDSPRDGKMWFGDGKYGSPQYYWSWRYTQQTIEEHIKEHQEEYKRLMRK